jgi:hypothetical protein
MGLETGTTIAALNAAWPLGTDPRSQGDDHLRLVKVVMQADALSKAAGGTVAGALTLQGINEIANNAPQLRFVETDQTSPAGRFRLIGGGGVAGTFFVQRNTAVAGDFTTTATIASFAAEGTTAPDTHTLVTREKGDGRYAQPALASLQTFAGPVRFGDVYVGANPAGVAAATTISGATGLALVLRGGVDTDALVAFRNNANTVVAEIGAAGTAAAAATTIMTRTKGDLRYAPKVLLLAALQALADSAPVAELRDALIAALSAPLEA